MDIDLLGYTDNDLANLESAVIHVCSRPPTEPDGIAFDAATVKAIRIKEDADYEGIRITFTARLDNARIPMQINIGFNDIVTPAPEPVAFPSLLGMPEPRLRGYSRETLVAEKVEAVIKLGEINSRMKDFYDIYALSRSFPFDLQTLASAIYATCRRRGTVIAGLPAILLPGSPARADKQVQWSAFLRKSRIVQTPGQFTEIAAAIAEFNDPAVSVQVGAARPSVTSWTAPGPWR